MRAMVLKKVGLIESSPLEWTNLPIPEPGPKEIRIKVHYCAICRTDLHVIEGDLPTMKLPLIPGHQIVGVVDQLGPGCQHFKLGERIGAAWLHSTCGQCGYCRSGKENLCEQSLYTGYHVNGGFAEYMIAKEEFVYSLPKEIDELNATPLLCAGIIGYRAFSRSNLPKNGILGIFGFGSSAHIVIQLALAEGAKIYVVTRAEKHQELARSLGATWAGARAEDLPEPLDSAILFAPAGDLVPTALRSLKKGGTLSVAGIHLSPIPHLDYHQDLFFEKDLRSVTANTRADGHALLSVATVSPIHMHTTVYPLAQANQALQDLKNDRIQGTGILLISGN